ncbi:MAG: transposase [Sphingomonas sp.]|uniref:IS66-like element accessory protein TnpA n=1 Tax=Sphingomonas sp. TaxID=28214 RepID=UPI0026011AF9|nr:transposase [Sphingomonas sp.]MBX9883310.1 transposase [Sphingomonas sp.]
MPGSRPRASLEPIRRFEVVTGVGRRRSFSVEEKLALVAQMADCGNICELARRHDLRPSQLFTWRRELRYAASAVQGANQGQSDPMFVPTVIEPVAPPASKRKPVRRTQPAPVPVVELEIDGVAVRIARGADAGVIAAVIDALKTAR